MAQSLHGVETTFTWDQALDIPQVLATSDGLTSLYGLGRLGVEQAGAWYYPQGDALDSVRQWTDALGAVLGTQSYSPYGEPLSALAVAPWGFTGEWHDPGGLVYLRARWYNPYLGRLTQPDTAAASRRDPQTLNRYTYANNNPLRYTDPTGHFIYEESPMILSSRRRGMDCLPSAPRTLGSLRLQLHTRSRRPGHPLQPSQLGRRRRLPAAAPLPLPRPRRRQPRPQAPRPVRSARYARWPGRSMASRTAPTWRKRE